MILAPIIETTKCGKVQEKVDVI